MRDNEYDEPTRGRGKQGSTDGSTNTKATIRQTSSEITRANEKRDTKNERRGAKKKQRARTADHTNQKLRTTRVSRPGPTRIAPYTINEKLRITYSLAVPTKSRGDARSDITHPKTNSTGDRRNAQPLDSENRTLASTPNDTTMSLQTLRSNHGLSNEEATAPQRLNELND